MIFSILKSLALGVWIGSLLMLGIAVAGPIFRESPSKTLAGNINGVILSRMNTIEWICGVLALLSAIVLVVLHWQDGGRTRRLIECGLIALAMIFLSVYSIRITGRMNELRASIKDFDHPQQTTEYVQDKEEFDNLHHTYTKIVGINMFVLLAGFALSVVNTRD